MVLLYVIMGLATFVCKAQSLEQKLQKLVNAEHLELLSQNEFVEKVFGSKKYNLVPVSEHEERYEHGLLLKSYKVNKGKKFAGYSLVYLYFNINNNEEVIYSELVKHNFQDNSYEVLYSINAQSELANYFNRVHVQRYGEKLDFKYINRSTFELNNVFGFKVGYSGSLPDQAKAMLNAVENKNTSEIQQMLKSINPVIKAYGLVGIELLKRDEIFFDRETERIVSLLKTGEVKVSVVSMEGCICCQTIDLEKILESDIVKYNMDLLIAY